MSRFKCVCGETIVTSGEIPHPYQWLLISDRQFDAFSGPTDAEVIYQAATLMFRCPASDHLWVFWNGLGEAPSLYAPDEVPAPLRQPIGSVSPPSQ